MLLKLEGFKYATSLDLNMGYYHIKLSPTSRNLFANSNLEYLDVRITREGVMIGQYTFNPKQGGT